MSIATRPRPIQEVRGSDLRVGDVLAGGGEIKRILPDHPESSETTVVVDLDYMHLVAFAADQLYAIHERDSEVPA